MAVDLYQGRMLPLGGARGRVRVILLKNLSVEVVDSYELSRVADVGGAGSGEVTVGGGVGGS